MYAHLSIPYPEYANVCFKTGFHDLIIQECFARCSYSMLSKQYECIQVGEVAAPAFTRAFFRLYLGSDPVSPDGKASISQQLANLVSQSGAAEQETGES